MAKVLGVGGVFFKSEDPQRLNAWYEKWLGLPLANAPGVSFLPGAMPEGGYTVWSVFDAGSEYFAPSARGFMINLVVDDLDEALRRVAEGGAELVGEVEEYGNGRFGWFLDPDGNKVELWEPAVEKGADGCTGG